MNTSIQSLGRFNSPALLLVAVSLLVSCSSESDPPAREPDVVDDSGTTDPSTGEETTDGTTSDVTDGQVADATEEPNGEPDVRPLQPSDYVREYTLARDFPAPEGMMWRRAIIHGHSTHSHDACDDQPRIDGEYNFECLAQLRSSVCRVRTDFLNLTDHPTHMAETPFLDLLIHDPETDRLIYDGETPIANELVCEDDFVVTVTAGFEGKTMPLAFHGHLDPDPVTRHDLYDRQDAEAIELFRAGGAIPFTAHTEEKSVEWVQELNLTGVEYYNLHTNLDPDSREEYLGLDPFEVFEHMVPFVLQRHDTSPDLTLAIFLEENPPALDIWAQVLEDRPLVGIAGTDMHRNVLPEPLIDGERFDGYRRMMAWFSNYVLAEDASLQAYEDALAAGRLFTCFDVFSDPSGFDAHVLADDGGRFEMGSTLEHEAGLSIEVALPDLSAQREMGTATTIRVLRVVDGTWDVVSESTEDTVSYAIANPGIYRVDVRIVPRHLIPFVADELAQFVDRDLIWIYTNAFRVVPTD